MKKVVFLTFKRGKKFVCFCFFLRRQVKSGNEDFTVFYRLFGLNPSLVSRFIQLKEKENVKEKDFLQNVVSFQKSVKKKRTLLFRCISC